MLFESAGKSDAIDERHHGVTLSSIPQIWTDHIGASGTKQSYKYSFIRIIGK